MEAGTSTERRAPRQRGGGERKRDQATQQGITPEQMEKMLKGLKTELSGEITATQNLMEEEIGKVTRRVDEIEPTVEAREAVRETMDEYVDNGKSRVKSFVKHLVPLTKKETGQLILGYGLGFLTGGRVAVSDWASSES